MPYDKAVLIDHRIQRARETGQEVKIVLEHDRLLLAENRIYYAMFYMVQALAHEFYTLLLQLLQEKTMIV